ncbi:ROK family protein [Clostridium hydrogenum]|uniref:ROK family protein n=1 Tax=Clostridium hydrogenum TaxID=2855764 RepID=UPI001F22032C|nr:ROK family protein [Clostridium hydrogenum]
MKNYMVFDVGGTKVKHGIINENGDILEKDKYDTNCSELGEFVDNMMQVIKKYEKKYELSGIGISLPGFINFSTGYSEKAGAITVLDNQNLKEILEKHIKLPIKIENDANCAALAEGFNGNAKGCSDYVCITIGTGIGGAIVSEGKLQHGHKFKSGEFGFMVLNENGGTSTVSERNSTRALIDDYKKYKGISDSDLVEGNTVFLEAEKDEKVAEIIEAWFQRVSALVFNISVVLNPEKVLIGGGISERAGFIKDIRKHLEKLRDWEDLKVDIDLCKHKNDAGIIGAFTLFI